MSTLTKSIGEARQSGSRRFPEYNPMRYEGVPPKAGPPKRDRAPRSSRASMEPIASGSQSVHGELIRCLQQRNWEFDQQGGKISAMARPQSEMEGAANQLVQSLTLAMDPMAESQKRHDTMMLLHSDAIALMRAQPEMIANQTAKPEQMAKAQQQMIDGKQRDGQLLI